jgi:hypothetical protein
MARALRRRLDAQFERRAVLVPVLVKSAEFHGAKVKRQHWQFGMAGDRLGPVPGTWSGPACGRAPLRSRDVVAGLKQSRRTEARALKLPGARAFHARGSRGVAARTSPGLRSATVNAARHKPHALRLRGEHGDDGCKPTRQMTGCLL